MKNNPHTPIALCLYLLPLVFLLSACHPSLPDEIEQAYQHLPDKIDFNFHIKPILSDRCFSCHGPDENKREADLRLDLEESAFAKLRESGGTAFRKGSLRKSRAWQRIISEDPDFQMPPPESHLNLSNREKALIAKWIEQGAEWKEHWAFLTLEKPEVPELETSMINPIDHFIRAKLTERGWTPAPETSKEQLIRRLSFDLTGLPPTPKEIDAFLADESENAYEKVVDRLLASPHFGERVATDWLDVARYADSHGFHADGYRMMWPWRDWVIEAFNENMPFDQFATWQLAGDLLPGATQEQKLATGFHRNNPTNGESGIVPEEYRLENVFDRTNTTAKAFMGLTLECARCHDHKYDPISQKEFFQLSAFFNNLDELGMIGVDGNWAPTMPLTTREVEQTLAVIQAEITQKEEALALHQKQALEQQAESVQRMGPDLFKKGLVGYYPLDKITEKQSPNQANSRQKANLKGDLEVVEGRSGKAIRFDSEYEHLSLEQVGDFERFDPFSMGAWVYPEIREPYTFLMGNSGHKNTHWRGYELFLDSLNRVSVRLTHDLPDHCLHVTTLDSIPLEKWSHVLFTYDGSSKAAGIRVYIDGKNMPLQVRYDRLYKSIRPIDPLLRTKPQAIRVGRSYRIALDIGLFEGIIDEIRIYDRLLSGLEVAGIVGNRFWENVAFDKMNKDDQQLLTSHKLIHDDPVYRKLSEELSNLRKQAHESLDTVPEIMVWREKNPPRKTFVLDRGAYDSPKEEVQPGVPSSLPPFTEEYPPNRLGLARWLVSPENPLTGRVLVNRYWHMIFGRGIVNTLEDFGNQGDLPTHPELLDWLAAEFQESGWDLKALLRLMVSSATYRQSSVADKQLLAEDPQNEWLARGPRYRLTAEMIRDNALMASGLLVNTIGGPSVKTYQPEGLWDKTHFSRLLKRYEHDSGEKLYKRSLYTFIRRTAPPPSMTVFDASDRSMCVVRRQNTNTPLQALLLLNEPQLLEASRIIAERVLREREESIDAQLQYAFRLLTSRKLEQEELSLMLELYDQEYQKYAQDSDAAEALMQTGEYPRDMALDVTTIAALTVVINIMMNFDEVYTKR